MLIAGCTLKFDTPGDNIPSYYEEEAGVVIDYCMYDPLPMESYMQYCVEYANADCCFWSQQHSDSWHCEYQWCFYWDSCEWEYIESECWW